MLVLLFLARNQYLLNPLADTRPEAKMLITSNGTVLKKGNENHSHSSK
jgi:hypothetical protein